MEPTCVRVYADQNQIDRTKNAVANGREQIQTYATMYNLLGNEHRMMLLYALHCEERLCVCDLTDILGISTPAVSQHLRKLKTGDLIESKRDAQRIYYYLSETAKNEFSNLFKTLTESHPKNALCTNTKESKTRSCCQEAQMNN